MQGIRVTVILLSSVHPIKHGILPTAFDYLSLGY